MTNGKPVFWSAPLQDIYSHLKTSREGLTVQEAGRRLEEHGRNEMTEKGSKSWFDLLLVQFKNPLAIILIFAAVISYFLGESTNSVVILAIVILNSLLGFFQEYRADRALSELKKYVTLEAKVKRGKDVVEIDTRDIVPGDIIHLYAGDVVPADIRLIEVYDTTCNEASLTGESLPVYKKMDPVPAGESQPHALHNMLFMGTSVASGSCVGVVVETGKDTFLGKTAAFLKGGPESDFQKNIRVFGNFLLNVTLVMTIFIFIANTVIGRGVFDSLLFALALSVGLTPEVLPIIITITLSNGVLKMAKQDIIVKRLATVEDFGNINTLCCDKTGTLTEGVLTLRDCVDIGGQTCEGLVLNALLCNYAKVEESGAFGNVVDKAIWNSKQAGRFHAQVQRAKVIDDNPLDFQRMRMSVLVQGVKSNSLIVKGAPESMLKISTHARVKRKDVRMTPSLASRINDMVKQFGEQGYIAIAVGEKRMRGSEISPEDESGITLQGFLLLLDPAKPTVPETLRTLQKIGVEIKIISGDNPFVTRKICQDVGLSIEEGRVITGAELDRLDEDEFEEYSKKYNVFSRVTPEHKHRIVASLNKKGNIVGFLGDGINDAPALKAADVGISVDSAAGIAKEAADIILLKKSLRVLARGIIEGRRTFTNITKYILNTMSANYGNMSTVAISSIFLSFIPLLPSQILLNNFISDVPHLAISTDNVDSEMLKKPKRWSMKLISSFMFYFGLISAFYDFALIIPLLHIIHAAPPLFRTAWFVQSALSEMLITFAIRTRLPFYQSRPSPWLIAGSLVAGAATLGITYLEVGNQWFEFVPMPPSTLALIGGILVAYFITAEMMKTYFFKKFEI